jgi:hypothetical protein
MLVLQQLVESGTLAEKDKLYFIFKVYNFQCRVTAFGLLFDCTYSKEGGAQLPCFLDRGGFSSLTDWADCCLQDLAGEYVTRFSSWKRIRHVKTNRLLSEIRDMERESKSVKDCPVYIHLQKQLLLYQQHLADIRIRMLNWKEWLVQQKGKPSDLVTFLEKAQEYTEGELYIFPDVATLKQLVKGGGKALKRKRPRAKRSVKKIDNPIAAVICSDTIGDEEYQNMLQEFFENVSR